MGDASSGGRNPVDTTAVTGGTDDRGDERPTTRLRRVEGPVDDCSPAPAVRLVREFKGLTVADLLRDEVVDRLPGQARAVLRHIERGDHAAAERALPGDFAAVLPGPRGPRRQRRMLVILVVLAAVLSAALAAASFSG